MTYTNINSYINTLKRELRNRKFCTDFHFEVLHVLQATLVANQFSYRSTWTSGKKDATLCKLNMTMAMTIRNACKA
jgi:hypothetical protein